MSSFITVSSKGSTSFDSKLRNIMRSLWAPHESIISKKTFDKCFKKRCKNDILYKEWQNTRFYFISKNAIVK